jgi:CSLREA domain-containing protein
MRTAKSLLLGCAICCALGHSAAWSLDFTVNSADDTLGDADTQDNQCDVQGNAHATPPIPYSGTCTLRAAIQQSNASGGKNTIWLNVQSISLTGPLPSITAPVVIQPIMTARVTLDGAGVSGSCLDVIAGSSEIRNLAIINCSGHGIELDGPGNTVEGNYIGVTASGDTKAPNANGILIASSGNTIGGNAPAKRNVISGNSGAGIYITGDHSRTNRIVGNFIGTDDTGVKKLANGVQGIYVDHAPLNVVGGSTAGERNVISGNASDGVHISNSPNTNVLGNYIGVDVTGKAALGNGGAGVDLDSSNKCVVGGAGAAARNVISANDSGVLITGQASSEDQVQGNYIGTDLTGSVAVPNSSDGVLISGASDNTIGGTANGTGNVISGNGKTGIQIEGSVSSGSPAVGNKVQGNYIGTDPAGRAALPNAVDGVYINAAPQNTIGGINDPAQQVFAGNVISGNGNCGIEIGELTASGNSIQGNFVGTDATGSFALANGSSPPPNQRGCGIFISDAPNTLIGDATQRGARNVVSGNAGSGILIAGMHAFGNKVLGNYVGTDASGKVGLGNADAGVFIYNAPNNQVGSATANPGSTPGNLISANNQMPGGLAAGVHVQESGAMGNTVRGNLIGTQADGKTALPNTKDGIFIAHDAGHNTVGGLQPGEGNVIAFNGRNGVDIDSGVSNAILSNAIFENHDLGIDLDTDGVTLPDAKGHGGANHELNFPILLSATPAAGGAGKVFSTPNTQFTIQVFSNAKAKPSGYDQGEKLLSTATIATDANGAGDFAIPPFAASDTISATATDIDNNTSEFSCGPLEKVPLGGALQLGQAACFKVYVPTRWGGSLSVSTPVAVQAATVLRSPDGTPFTNGSETGRDKHGWYMVFTPDASSAYPVSNAFREEGEARTVPWNFFYFPLKASDPRAHLYDVPGAFTKLDASFALGTAGVDWETARHKRMGASWEGHCWGAALASIILQQPRATGAFTEDELEGLAADFFNESGATPLAPPHGVYPSTRTDGLETYPFAKPTPAPGEDVDRGVHQFHIALRTMLKLRRKPLHMNLRQSDGLDVDNTTTPPTPRDDEVWNQGCYSYSSNLKEDPNAAGDEETEKVRQIRHDTRFTCNDDFVEPRNATGVSIGNPRDTPDYRREQESEYVLIYGNDGDLIANGTIAGNTQNWLSMTLTHYYGGNTNTDVFVPSVVMDVSPAGAGFRDSDTAHPSGAPGQLGGNPYVTGHRLSQLGMKKNPGF